MADTSVIAAIISAGGALVSALGIVAVAIINTRNGRGIAQAVVNSAESVQVSKETAKSVDGVKEELIRAKVGEAAAKGQLDEQALQRERDGAAAVAAARIETAAVIGIANGVPAIPTLPVPVQVVNPPGVPVQVEEAGKTK